MAYKIYTSGLFSYSLVALLIVSASPFFSLGGAGTYLILFSVAFYIFNVLRNLKGCFYISRDRLNMMFFTVLMIFYIFFPFREYDRVVSASIWFFLSLTVFGLRDSLLIQSLKVFSNFIYWVCLLALAILLLKLLGIPVPYYIFEVASTSTSKEYFFVYPGTAMLANQNYEVFGRELFRLSGIFSEPGHFGVICALVLYCSSRIISEKRRYIILFAGILTLSMGFYVLLLGYVLLSTNLRAQSKKILLIIAVIGTAAALLPQEFYQRFFLKKLDTQQSVLDSRSSEEFNVFYNEYTSQNLGLIGGGRFIMSENNIRSSDYRAFLLKYGYLGLLLYLIWFFVVTRKADIRVKLLTFIFFIVVFAHRSWMTDYFIFIFAIYAIPLSYKIYENEIRA